MKRNITGFLLFFVVSGLIFLYTVRIYPGLLIKIGGYENENTCPTLIQSLMALCLITPVVLVYFVATKHYFLKFKRFNKFVYPIIVLNIHVLVFFAGIGCLGVAFGWVFLIAIISIPVLLVLGIIFGWKSDNECKKMENNIIPVIMISGTNMGLFSKPKAVKEGNPYLGLRQLALNIKPQDLGVTLNNNEQVYAAVVDIPLKGGLVTLACFLDNTVSLYYQNGSGMIEIGQKYEDVRIAGMSFLFSAGQTLKLLTPADNFNLPNTSKACVYLKASDNTYKAEYDMGNVQNESRHIQFINFLVQNTLNFIREIQGFSTNIANIKNVK